MIKINLLPSELQGRRYREKAPAPPLAGSLVVAVVVVAVAAVCLGTAYYFVDKITSATRQANQLTRDLNSKQKLYDARFAENERIKKKWDRLKVQEEILNGLAPENPLYWSEKLNMLASAIPSGVYITQLEVQDNTELVETEYSVKQREAYEMRKAKAQKQEKGFKKEEAAPPTIKKPVVKQTLVIRAVSTGKNQTERFDKMLAFERALRGYSMTNPRGEKRAFMDNFLPEIAFGTAESIVYDGMEVWSFEFKLLTKPFGVNLTEEAGKEKKVAQKN